MVRINIYFFLFCCEVNNANVSGLQHPLAAFTWQATPPHSLRRIESLLLHARLRTCFETPYGSRWLPDLPTAVPSSSRTTAAQVFCGNATRVSVTGLCAGEHTVCARKTCRNPGDRAAIRRRDHREVRCEHDSGSVHCKLEPKRAGGAAVSQRCTHGARACC